MGKPSQTVGKKMKQSILQLVVLSILVFMVYSCGHQDRKAEVISAEGQIERKLARFEPPQDNVLVFVGQDNKSVGGTQKYNDGYYDHVGVPAGVTHYVYFAEGKENPFGFSFDNGTVDGLNQETTWGAGPMCMKCYLDSEAFANTLVHLSISMEFDSEEEIAAGQHQHLIDELAAFLSTYSHVPFLIRIGYEFEGSWNHYQPEAFKQAWITYCGRVT